MNLLVDIGNSNLKWCISENENIGDRYSIQYSHSSIDSIETVLFSLLNNEKRIQNIKNIFVCCVSNEKIKSTFLKWAIAELSLTPKFYESSDNLLGVKNAYSKVSMLGNDRWLSIVYAYHLYQSDVCIIDCGTAVTVDVVLKNGQHVGGLIAPGYNSQIKALGLNTDIIDNNDFRNQKSTSFLQNNTHHCIEQGCRLMLLGFIRDVVNQLNLQYGDKLQVVITGGDCESIASELPTEWHIQKDLLLEGLLFYSTQIKSELI